VNPWEGKGDPSYWREPVVDAFVSWGKFNGCQDLHEYGFDWHHIKHGAYEAKLSQGCKEGAEVQLVKLEGNGHTWPGEKRPPASEAQVGPSTDDVSANEMMWDFFWKHPMPQKAISIISDASLGGLRRARVTAALPWSCGLVSLSCIGALAAGLLCVACIVIVRRRPGLAPFLIEERPLLMSAPGE
ncbi:unnamed protein product, partial [Polarella glacialis]